ncbi:hypothetical protein J6590_047188 [Homalodisca vitripennis]|nr:hypothetical protein J6590_047188 [Homalodisca vitripennis]
MFETTLLCGFSSHTRGTVWLLHRILLWDRFDSVSMGVWTNYDASNQKKFNRVLQHLRLGQVDYELLFTLMREKLRPLSGQRPTLYEQCYAVRSGHLVIYIGQLGTIT